MDLETVEMDGLIFQIEGWWGQGIVCPAYSVTFSRDSLGVCIPLLCICVSVYIVALGIDNKDGCVLLLDFFFVVKAPVSFSSSFLDSHGI